MDKKSIKSIQDFLWVVVAVFVIAAFFLIYSYTQTPKELSEIQTIACYSAEQGNTCFTKLLDLDIVTPENCCKMLNYCCKTPK